MRILAIESSAKAASVAITDGGNLVAEVFLNSGLKHSVTIMPSVERLLESTGLSVRDMDRLAISAGPGSFTGLRIGMAAIKGLSWACGVPCCAVSTLEAAAMGVAHIGGIVCAVMDARAGQVYNALFRAEGGKLFRLCEDRAIAISDLLRELSDKKDVIFVGDGAELCYNEENGAHRLAPRHLRCQRAAYVALLAENAEVQTAEALRPEYIRLPQAERERLEKLKK